MAWPAVNLTTLQSIFDGENVNYDLAIEGNHLLTTAIGQRNYNLTKFCLARGSNAALAEYDGYTALMLVMKVEWTDEIKADVLRDILAQGRVDLTAVSSRGRNSILNYLAGACREERNYYQLANLVATNLIEMLNDETSEAPKQRIIADILSNLDVLNPGVLLKLEKCQALTDEQYYQLDDEISRRVRDIVNDVISGDHNSIHFLRASNPSFLASRSFKHHSFKCVSENKVSRENLEIIFDQNFNPNFYYGEKGNFLMYALYHQNYELVNFLLDRGASVDFTGETKDTPFSMALKMDECPAKHEILLRLLSKEEAREDTVVNVNVRNQDNIFPHQIVIGLIETNPIYIKVLNRMAEVAIERVKEGGSSPCIRGQNEQLWVDNAHLLTTDVLRGLRQSSVMLYGDLDNLIAQREAAQKVVVQEQVVQEQEEAVVEDVVLEGVNEEELGVGDEVPSTSVAIQTSNQSDYTNQQSQLGKY